MKTGAVIVASKQISDNSRRRRTQAQIFTKILGKWGHKYQHHIYAIGTTMIVSGQAIPAHAFGLFDPTQIALTCMFGGTAAQGNALMSTLPAVINAAITVMLFVYFVASGVKVANAIGDGQEITQVIQQPVGIFFITLVLFIAQQILFADITAACT